MTYDKQSLLDALTRRGFQAHSFATAREAADFVLGAIEPTQSVGIGGSVTVEQMGLYPALTERGNTVYWHWKDANAEAARRAAMNADVYLCSANALTESGRILNIDGTGNRLAATLYGPPRVFFLIGENKICADENAMDRAKTHACPPNARRLSLDTPCARLNRCVAPEGCRSPQRMCAATVTLERARRGCETHVVVIGEALGY